MTVAREASVDCKMHRNGQSDGDGKGKGGVSPRDTPPWNILPFRCGLMLR